MIRVQDLHTFNIPGGPVVKALFSDMGTVGSMPVGELRPHRPQSQKM